MAEEFDSVHGPVIALPFFRTDATAGETETDMIFAGGLTGSVAPMPKAGSVVGIAIHGQAATTAGSAIFKPHINSTEFAAYGVPWATINTTSPSTSYASCRAGVCTFTAGQLIGISMTSDATFAPDGTTDFDALLFITLNPD